MRYLRLFESRSASSIIDLVSKYKETLDFIRPAVLEKYNDMVENESNYEIIGNTPYKIDDENKILLNEMYYDHNTGLIYFVLLYWDEFENDRFHVPFSKAELNDAIIKIDAKQYNL